MKTKLNTDRKTGTLTLSVHLDTTHPIDHLSAQWLAGDPSDLMLAFRYETTPKGSFLYYNVTDLLPLDKVLRGAVTESFARNLLLTACDAIELCNNNYANPVGLLFSPRHVYVSPETKLASFVLVTSLIVDKSVKDSLGQLVNAVIKSVPSHARDLAALRDYAFAHPSPAPKTLRQLIWEAFTDTDLPNISAAPRESAPPPAKSAAEPAAGEATILPADGATILKSPAPPAPAPLVAHPPTRTAFTVTRARDGRMAIVRKREATIGRSAKSDIHMGGNSDVSRKHAQIVVEGDAFLLTDLDSKNGTFVNGQRLASGHAATLHDGDKFALSGDVFTIETLQQAPDSDTQS